MTFKLNPDSVNVNLQDQQLD